MTTTYIYLPWLKGLFHMQKKPIKNVACVVFTGRDARGKKGSTSTYTSVTQEPKSHNIFLFGSSKIKWLP